MAKPVYLLSRQRIVGETNGSSIYLLSIVKYLVSRGFEVHYICPTPHVFGRWPFLALRPEIDILASYRIRGSIRLGRYVVNPDPRVAWQAALAVADKVFERWGLGLPKLSRKPEHTFFSPLPLTPADAAYLRSHVPPEARAILCDYASMTPALDLLARPGARSAVVMHDLFSAQYPTVSAVEEFANLGRADLVIAIQPEEASIVAERLPGQAVTVAPMAIEPVSAASAGDQDRLLFVASHTPANVEALTWFCEAVWPLLAARRPTLRLDVAGTVARGMVRVPEGVRLLGLVPDLQAAYAGAGIVISPLRSGTGLKIKLIEALAQGKAVVATTTTMQGVQSLGGEVVKVSDDPAEFAAHVLALAGDEAERKRLGERGIAVVRERFNADVCYSPIARHFEAGWQAGA